MGADKAALRRDALAARDAVGDRVRAQASDALGQALRAYHGQTIAGYHPMRGEADPLLALAQAAAAGTVGLPVVMARATPLRFRAWGPDATMIVGAFGAMIPESGDWITPRVVVVPLVGFDDAGGRLGYGGGFYDRTLQQLRAAGAVVAIGFAFEAQRLDRLPQEPTDQPLDAVVTEAGLSKLATAAQKA